MIYIAPPDNFTYLEKYDEQETFYKRYNEIKGNISEINDMLQKQSNPNVFLIPEVYGDVDALKVRTLYADYYNHDITVRKHARYSPDILHDHNFFEMIYVLKGKANNTIEDQLYKMTDGDICLIPPNVFHRIWVDDDSLVINIIIKKTYFDDDFFQKIIPNNSLTKFIKQNLFMQSIGEKKFHMYHSFHNAPLRNLIAVLISEALKGQNSLYIKKALTIAVFNYLVTSETYEDNFVNDDNEIANSILEHIQENYSTVTLTSLAKHFNYSEPYLSKLIQNITGVSYINILQTAKLKEACHLLATTNCKICDIPAKVGYESTVYFNRVFKQKIGVTPYKYRKMHKETYLIRLGDN